MMQFDLFGGPAAFAEVAGMLCEALDQPSLELSLAMPLEELPGWDDGHIRTIMDALSRRFGVVLAPHEVAEVQTVGDVVRLIGAHRVLDAD